MQLKTFKIQLNGRVQGVGFRPFIFNLAKENKLVGSVSNNANGVLIYINTSEKKAATFVQKIIANKPEVAIIARHSIEEIKYKVYEDFTIISSENNQQINIPLTPEFAVCNTCKQEIKDSNNRRYNYAFTTCVHCGPRYAITTKFPFERANTTLSNFEMCPDCKEEYTNPSNRRFHSQTNSCKTCGITLRLVDNLGKSIIKNQQEIIQKVAHFISEGKIIALKNTNGYLLCCDATNKSVIKKLRQRKLRPNKPFAVLYPSIETIKADFEITISEENSLQSRIAPIVILKNSKKTTIASETIAPNLKQTGVMLPSSSLLELIVQSIKKPIIATSGNISGSPIISEEKEAQEKLQNVADYFLHHNLKIEFPQDDSVLKFVNNQTIILRRSRGLAPNYLEIKNNASKPILAMGAHLKSTFSFTPNNYTYISQYFGNLDNYDVFVRYQNTIEKYQQLFNTQPKTILIDKHLQYQSSILGKELSEKNNTKLVAIQHHKAHFTSVLGEHDLFTSKEKILGIIWDGTGLGDDDNIWGGEFFTYQNQEITRTNHFEYFNWLANDKMAKEPRLSLFSVLLEESKFKIKEKFTATEWNLYSKIIKNNTLKTSSVGRLFDAVSSALDIVDKNSFEANAAMQLEDCAKKYSESNYIDFLHCIDYNKIPSSLIIEAIVLAYKNGICKERLAYSFIYTLAKIIIKEAKKNNIKIVVCSGGVFQNSLLISILLSLSIKENISIKLNRKLSANDENISFGQLMYHQHIKN